MRHQLQPNKATYDKAVLVVYIRSSKRRFNHPSLVARQSTLILKVGVSYGWRTISKQTDSCCRVKNYGVK